METFIGFLAGIGFTAMAAAIVYLLIQNRKLKNDMKEFVSTNDFVTFQSSVEKVTRADEILKEVRMYGQHVVDLNKLVIENNKILLTKVGEHDKAIAALIDSFKRLSDYVANSDK